MSVRLTFVMVIGVSVVTLQAAKIDPRLATVRKAVVQPVDVLSDKPMTACFAEHLFEQTPVAVVASIEEADVVLRVGVADKRATITAWLPDGKTKMWSEESGIKAGFGLIKVTRDACGLADQLIEQLRQAMMQARGK